VRKKLPIWAKYHIFVNRDGSVDKTSSLRVYGNSKVNINEVISGGDVESWNASTLTIGNVSGGNVWSRGNSTLTIENDNREG